MQRLFSRRSRFLITLLVVMFALLTATVASAETLVFNGFIASGAQFDLYQVFLTANTRVTATLVCDEIAPGDRPLDPVLSVFDPFSDPSDTINATYYNDDGFGADDFPNGVDCNAFDSSIVNFITEFEGWYTFRADGFGSSTGPYTLTITHVANLGHAFTDGRINPHNQATAIVYCSGNNADIYTPGGALLMTITPAEASAVANGAVIEAAGGVTVSKTPDGRLSMLAPLAGGKAYLFIWNGCPPTASETYTIEGGVGILFETRSY